MVGSVDLRRLHMLRLVAQYGTVTATAEALHLTPSAVSHQIRQLARELGVALLEPAGRGVRLTPAGHTLIAHADALHAGWEAAQADLAVHADGSAGLLRLAGFPTAVTGLLAPAAARLQASYPRLAVTIAEVETVEGFSRVLSGEADLAVVMPTPDTPPLGDAKFDQQTLFDEPLDLLVPADHRLAACETVTLADAADQPWIVAAPGSCDFYQLVLAACAAAGFTPRIAHHAQDCVSVPTLVSCGLGLALVPRLAPLPSHHSAVRIPLPGQSAPTRRILTCVRAGSHRQPAIARGLDALHEVGQQLPPPLSPAAQVLDQDHDHQRLPHRHGRIPPAPASG